MRPVVSKLAFLVCASAVCVALSGCGAQTQSVPPPASTGSALDGEQLVSTKCTLCHNLDRVNDAEYDSAGWTDNVARMQQNGLVVTDEEKDAIIDYLSSR